jgi:lysozyme
MAKITSASQGCVDLVKHFEGLKFTSYLCPANVWTIGYGTTIYPDGRKVGQGQTCTEQQANDFLKHDLSFFERTVDSYTRDDVSQQQFDAMVSFCYNLGPKNLKDSSLLKVINQNPNDFDNIQTQWLKWNRGGGKVLPGLTKRRSSEFHFYKTGTLKFDF